MSENIFYAYKLRHNPMKIKQCFYPSLMILLASSGLIFLAGCERKDEPSRMELLTSTWWSMTDYCGTPTNCEGSCILAFHQDGTCTEEDYYNGFYSWNLKNDDQILELNQEDYKILVLTESVLKIKRDWLLGCTYTYKSLSIAPVVKTLGVSDITQTSAKFYGNIKSDQATVAVKIEYGTTISYGSMVFVRNVSGMNSIFIAVEMKDFFEPGTTYHYRLTAADGKETFYGQDLTFRTFNTQTVTDIDGNIYNTVDIGTQTWMAENLKVTEFDDGTPIPLITVDTIWGGLTSPGYCWRDNDSATYKDTEGALYNWYAVSEGNLCPAGWHVPGDEEWTTLEQFLGQDAVMKMFEGAVPSGGTNESSFSASSTYYRDDNGGFGGITYWWSSTEDNTLNAWSRSGIERISLSKKYGVSLRCVKD